MFLNTTRGARTKIIKVVSRKIDKVKISKENFCEQPLRLL